MNPFVLIFSLMVNTRNANCFTGKQGYKSLEKIAEMISEKLSEKQKNDEEHPKKIKGPCLVEYKYDGVRVIAITKKNSTTPVSYTHLTLPTKA